MKNKEPRVCKAPETLNDAIAVAKQNAVNSILFWVREGLTLQDASERVKRGSCFGPKVWGEVVNTAAQEVKS